VGKRVSFQLSDERVAVRVRATAGACGGSQGADREVQGGVEERLREYEIASVDVAELSSWAEAQRKGRTWLRVAAQTSQPAGGTLF
jgi:hypothetical protein